MVEARLTMIVLFENVDIVEVDERRVVLGLVPRGVDEVGVKGNEDEGGLGREIDEGDIKLSLVPLLPEGSKLFGEGRLESPCRASASIANDAINGGGSRRGSCDEAED